MNILLIIAAIFIVTETINPEVDEGKKIQKKEVVAETVETKTSEEIISEAQAAEEAQAAAEAKAAELLFSPAYITFIAKPIQNKL